jgi:diguanylate cyclase
MSDTTNSDKQRLSNADRRREIAYGSDDPATDRSAELLRLALPMISRHGRGFAPISYSVWYEYVRGENHALRSEVDNLLQGSPRLNAEITFDIYRKHVVGEYEKAVLQGRANLLGVLDNISESVDATATTTGDFDQRLEVFSDELGKGIEPQALQQRISTFREDLATISQTMHGLNDKLRASRDEVERLADELVKAREEAQLDPLTGLPNRRTFGQALERAVIEAGTGEQAGALTLLVVDIDHFKKINDEHGHLFGDKVIRGVARILDDGVMRKDCVARYGGEEFALILPQTDLVGGTAVAQRIRDTVSRSRIRRAKSDKVLTNITVSIGVAQFRGNETAEQFFERADKALYAAKQGGRNRVEAAG